MKRTAGNASIHWDVYDVQGIHRALSTAPSSLTLTAYCMFHPANSGTGIVAVTRPDPAGISMSRTTRRSKASPFAGRLSRTSIDSVLSAVTGTLGSSETRTGR